VIRHPFAYPRLVCRPALPGDTRPVLEFTKQIWDGGDYVPLVWADWLADPDGLLAAAEYGGRCVGIGKLSLPAPDQWWLEGLRVDPDYEGRGIGSRLHDYLLNHWLAHGGGVVRLLTASYREKVRHLCERNGFSQVCELTSFKAPALDEPVEVFEALPEHGSGAALELALQAPSLRYTAGLMDIGWQFITPVETHLQQASRAGRAWRHGRSTLLTVWEEEEGDSPPFSMVGMLACEESDLTTCLLDYRRLAARLGYRQAGWFAPLHPGLLPALQAAGFERDWDETLLLYQKVHPASA
jgi:GNAT superfamily N-acetyltransferase